MCLPAVSNESHADGDAVDLSIPLRMRSVCSNLTVKRRQVVGVAEFRRDGHGLPHLHVGLPAQTTSF